MSTEHQNLFGKAETQAVKGIALILMLTHHLFLEPDYLADCRFLWSRGADLIYSIANFSKVCVAIFLLLSGYGLVRTYAGKEKDGAYTLIDSYKDILKRIAKLLVTYWWALVPFMLLGILSGRRPLVVVYGPGRKNIVFKLLLDLLGISFLKYDFRYLYNISCWYFAIAILFYLFFPLLKRLMDKSIPAFCGVVLLFAFWGKSELIVSQPNWIVPFAVGMLLAKYGILDRMVAQTKEQPAWAIIGSLVMFPGVYLLRRLYPIDTDVIAAIAIICAVVSFSSVLPILKKALMFVGKHSTNMYISHTFFFMYYGRRIIYAPKYPILILPLLLIVCLIHSIMLEFIKGRAKAIVRFIRLQTAGNHERADETI